MPRKLMAFVLLSAAVALMAVGAISAAPTAIEMCSNLMNSASLHALPDTTITSATTVSGAFTPPNGKAIEGLPSFCRVTATVKPSPVSDIKVEVWLPANWNGKLEGVGDGGLAGSVIYTAAPYTNQYYQGESLEQAIKLGYAAASTDTGHVESDNSWVADVEKEKDYGYRGMHGMTVTAKAVVQAFYGNAPKRSYFNGCSTGGGEALGEAQLYPADYDGIIAASSQNALARSRAFNIWQFQAMGDDPAAAKVSRASLQLVTTSVLKQCGGPNGLADGFLSTDPRACKFDPADLLCKANQDPSSCLTSTQVKVMKKFYDGWVSQDNKQQLWPGLPRGSEGPIGPGTTGWDAFTVMNRDGKAPGVGQPGVQFYSVGVLQDPNLNYRTMNLETALDAAEKKFGFIEHKETDLEPFMQHGGKLLLYHGWDDASIPATNTINYYNSVVETVRNRQHLSDTAALTKTQMSARLFLVPGVGHCGGGPGPDSFDALGTLDQWVDHSKAPEKIIASHVEKGVTTYSRPLCPYPQEAQYTGSGERADANNWTCVARPVTVTPSFYKVVSSKRGKDSNDKTAQNESGSARGE